jgi:hypothetical protein
MHRNIVPPDQKLPRTERAVGLSPALQNVAGYMTQNPVHLRKLRCGVIAFLPEHGSGYGCCENFVKRNSK